MDRARNHDAVSLGLPLIDPRPLSREVATVLRERILTGALRPGQRLIEVTLSQQLGLSRGPVREALRQLASEGLVQEEPHRGARVARLTATDVHEICEVRAALEGKAAERVAVKHPEALEELRSVLNGIEAAAEQADARKAIELDLEFHDTLCRLSGNKRLHAAFRTTAPVLRTLFLFEESAFRAGIAELAGKHEVIIAAIATGDLALIRETMDQHIATAQGRLLEAFSNDQEPVGP